MNTVTDLVRALDVTPATIRRWSKEFADFLSTHATPPKGETRLYTDEDAAALALVADMRRVNSDYETICAALAAGDVGRWPPKSDQADEDAPRQSDDRQATQLITQLTAAASQWEATAHTIADERDRLVSELEDERAARLEAEIRATRAETQLEAMSIMGDVNQRKGGAWQRLKDWIAGESQR